MKHFFYLILTLSLTSCSATKKLIPGDVKSCSTNFDCFVDNSCLNFNCINEKCSYLAKENNTNCGDDNLCYEGECVIASGVCSTETDCFSNNTCKDAICSSGVCLYINKDENTSCGDSKNCVNGFCSSACYIDSDCDDNNACTTEACSGFYEMPYDSYVSISKSGNNYWLLSATDDKLYKYDLSWNYLGQSIDIELENGSKLFVKDNKFYILLNHYLKIYSSLGIIESEIDLRTLEGLDSNITQYLGVLDGFYFDGTYWYIYNTFGASIDENFLELKLDADLNYLAYKMKTIPIGLYTMSRDANNYFFYESASRKLYKYNLNLEEIGMVFELNFLNSGSNIRALIINEDAIDMYLSSAYPDHKYYIYQFNSDFSVISSCEYIYKEAGSTCGENGWFCKNGNCLECINHNTCDDENICTQDTCFYGVCENTKLNNGTTCGDDKFCLDSVCTNGCYNDAECPNDTTCKNYSCNQVTHECYYEAINPGVSCGELAVCTENGCNNAEIGSGMCSNFILNTNGTVNPALIVINQDELTSFKTMTGLTLQRIVFKYEDADVLKCAGFEYIEPAGVIFAVYGDVMQTSPKEGFAFSELFNIFVRADDYICRVNPTYYPDYPNNKWYPFGFSKIKDFGNIPSQNIKNSYTASDINCKIDANGILNPTLNYCCKVDGLE